MRRFSCEKKPPKVKRLSIRGTRQRTTSFRLNLSKNADHIRRLAEKENHSLPSTSETTTQPVGPSSVFEGKPVKSSKYLERKQKLSEAWASFRTQFLEVRTKEFSPATYICQKCGQQENEIIRCLDCSSVAYYCQKCSFEVHQTVLFHVPNIWKGKMFVPLSERETPTIRRLDHACDTCYIRQLCIVDVNGKQHKANFTFCLSEKESISVLRFGFWPATPEKPVVAFHLDFMELVTVLQIESQLSVKSLCDALQYMRHFRIDDVKEVKDIYRTVVGDSSNEYRYHRTMMKSGKHLDFGVDYGSCPACSKNTGHTVICMDANFGLVHKRTAGIQDLSSARHTENPYMHDQTDVDKFLASYRESKNEGCASFQAGNAVRSKVKNSKLDITGVFGSVCKHDHPIKFCNLRHGERLGYAVYHLEKQINEIGGDQQLILMYDIACMLHRHLMRNNKDELLAKTTFAVPVFHSFAHNMQCQILYGQRHVDGTGLTDGEGIERLWSFLRRFSKISKEMTLGNRQDLLVDALYHYSEKLNMKLVDRIVSRITRAITLKDNSLKELQKSTNEDIQTIKNSYEERKRSASVKHPDGGKVSISSEEEYSWILVQSHKIRCDLEVVDASDEIKSKLTKELESYESQLFKIEKKLKITERWTIDHVIVENLLTSYRSKRKQILVRSMKNLAIERQFLLSSLKKYADGQDIALRLGKQLKVVGQKMTSQLRELNTIGGTSFQLKDVSDVSSEFYNDVTQTSIQDQNKVFELLSSLLRAEEEFKLSIQDMQSTVMWLIEQLNVIGERINVCESNDSPSRMVKSELNYLMLLKMAVENWLVQASEKFSPYLETSFDFETPVINFVLKSMNFKNFEETVSSDEVAETLELIDAFEKDDSVEEGHIDIGEDESSDDEI